MPHFDKEIVKEGYRKEDRANGQDNPPQSSRPTRGMDGDPKVNRPLSRKEFDENLNSLKNNRACGSDGLKNELLKNGSDKFKDLLFIFINEILTTGHIPEVLNEGRVKLLYKRAETR